MEQSSAAEQRAFAVAKLKRAASLPRMKDGRRPPMHVEAVSEGEKSQVEGKSGLDGNEDASLPPTETAQAQDQSAPTMSSHETEDESAKTATELESEPKVDLQSVDEQHVEVSASGKQEDMPPEQKKRRRSRSRSRGSKDLKAKLRVIASSPRMLNHTSNESSQDEDLPSRPPSPPVFSPRPSRFNAETSAVLESPLYPGTTPSTPMLPSLEALQKGLFRSNSASSGVQRMMAMAKLTGEIFDPSILSPSPAGKLARNNTVAGGERGERMAARALLFHRLAERINTEGDQTSGGEEVSVRIPTPTRRRRRHRRSSSRIPTVVDDRDEPSTTPNTPLVPSSPSLPIPTPLPPPPPIQTEDSFVSETPLDRRGPLIEDEDDVPPRSSPLSPGLPHTPNRSPPRSSGRKLHVSDANFSSDSIPGVGVPFFLSQKNILKGDVFPTSPFATPLREKAYLEDEEEQATYKEMRREPVHDSFDREISWVAEPVPESRMPINDEDEDDNNNSSNNKNNTHDDDDDDDEHDDDEHEGDGDDEDDALEPVKMSHRSPSHRTSLELKSLLVEHETSPEVMPSRIPPSPSSAAALSNRLSDGYSSAPTYPTPPLATPLFGQAPTNAEYTDWEEQRTAVTDVTPKRSEGGYWERVKNTFSRTGSQSGRRSRTNSVGTRQARDHTDSSISRESGASLTSAKTDKGDTSGTFAYQQSQPIVQTHTSSPASASVLSLAPHAPKGGVSPIPAASTADLLKYADAKLFPFPGMMELEKQRTKAKVLLNSASTPDIVLGLDQPMSISASSSMTTRSPDTARDRKLSHQASDSRLIAKFSNAYSPQIMSTAPSSNSIDYFSIPTPHSATTITPTQSGPMKLPTTREGVKKWLTAKKIFSSSSGTTTPNVTSPSPSPGARSPQNLETQPSISDFLVSRKDTDLIGDWEEVGSDKSRTATNTSGSTLRGKRQSNLDAASQFSKAVDEAFGINASNSLGKANSNGAPDLPGTPKSDIASDPPSTIPSPPEPPSSTPDPQSSLDDYPTRSTSASFSTLSSHPAVDATCQEPQNPTLMERLDDLLARGPRNSTLPLALDDPPRKLILSSPVLQVVNSNTVKDRFLFLFNDILVIAKPMLQDQDGLLDSAKLSIPDRRFLIKSVVQLRHLRLRIDRDDNSAKAHMSGSLKHTLIRTFVHQFAKDPDQAIATLFEKARSRDDPVGLGQLMFRTLDLDRAKLGDYLSRRTSKFVLKSYVDGFGFAGLRVDKALRVFLQTINIPAKSYPHFNPAEYILDAFAGRWYDANSSIVAYDKDLAVKLVRALVQLNEVLHGGIAQEPGVTGFPKRNITARDFIEAFRRYDTRGLISDELLEDVFGSVRHERLTQARNSAKQDGLSDTIITIKRGLPLRLTYRIQSEPVILRIPQPDAQLSIELFGQDLTFDPPVLNFTKSSEASFRVTGTSLGPKTIIMWRTGANALCYSGLPQSSTIMVERAFMRNTFQIAFADFHEERRRYMFSVDDPVLRHQWAMSLKRQADIASNTWESAASDPGTSKFHLAAESMAFKVLQETMLGDDVVDRRHPEDSFASSYSPPHSPNGKFSYGDSRKKMVFGGSLHARSKSRSKVYHRSIAGKMEIDLEVPINDDTDIGDVAIQPHRVWNGQEVELVCRQNSFTATILSHLLASSPGQSPEDLGESRRDS